MSNTATKTVKKANITSFPAFFKEKQHDMYMALLSEKENMTVLMFDTTDTIRRDSYLIDVTPDEDYMKDWAPSSEEEFTAALHKAQARQTKWYEQKLHYLTTNNTNIVTGS